MDQSWAWGIYITIAVLVTGTMVGISPGLIDRSPKLGWWILVVSPIPLVIWDILWVIMTNPVDNIRRPVSIIIGMLSGALILFALTEMLHAPAKAQSSLHGNDDSSSPSTPYPTIQQNNQGAPNIVVPGSGNNFNFGAPSSIHPSRDPDGIYQFDRQVGTVKFPDAQEQKGLVTFASIIGIQNLNMDEVFEYRNYRLKMIKDSIAIKNRSEIDGEIRKSISGLNTDKGFLPLQASIVGRIPDDAK